MAIWAKIATFIGEILKRILPVLFKELKKPKENTYVGENKDLADDMLDDLTDGLSADDYQTPRHPDVNNGDDLER